MNIICSQYNYDLRIYKEAILQSLSIVKRAQDNKLMTVLEKLNISQDVKNYVLSLPKELQGFAVGHLNKNNGISKENLESYIAQVKEKQEKKYPIKDENILNELLSKYSTTPEEEKWFRIQWKKYPDKHAELISYAQHILKFVYRYHLDIVSYNVSTLLNEMKKEMFGSRSDPNDPLDNFFWQIRNQESSAIDRYIDYATTSMAKWVRDNFLKFRKEWRHKIEKYMKETGKSFPQILQEGQALMEAQQAGELRGQDMPNSPLHHPEHAILLSNLENLNDWYENSGEFEDFQGSKLFQMSVNDAINASKQWHEEETKKGGGKQYDPINTANIVYGPNNWKDEKNNGYFILELKSANDLKTEGFKMNHCVGSYCFQVESGETRIFSLRNQSDPDKPILTIETDPSMSIIRQDYGPGNSKIDDKFHKMIDEWNGNIPFNEDAFQKMQAWERVDLIASNPDRIPINILLKTVDDLKGYISNIAKIKNLPQEVYNKILNNIHNYDLDVKTTILFELGANTSVSNEILQKILLINKEYNWDSISKIIAINTNANIETLEKVFEFNVNLSIGVISELCKNNNISSELINKIFNFALELLPEAQEMIRMDYNIRDIFFRLARRTNTSQEVLQKIKNIYPSAIANSPFATQEDLYELYLKGKNTNDVNIISELARNPNTSINILEEIINLPMSQQFSTIRSSLIRNPKLPNNLLELFLNDDNPAIVRSIKNRLEKQNELINNATLFKSKMKKFSYENGQDQIELNSDKDLFPVLLNDDLKSKQDRMENKQRNGEELESEETDPTEEDNNQNEKDNKDEVIQPSSVYDNFYGKVPGLEGLTSYPLSYIPTDDDPGSFITNPYQNIYQKANNHIEYLKKLAYNFKIITKFYIQ